MSNKGKTKTRSVELLYQESCNFHRFMIEWRHKILLRYFVSIVAMLYIAQWIWDGNNAQLRAFLFLPFLIASILSLLFFLLDRRNIDIMYVSAKTGKELEEELFAQGGFFVRYYAKFKTGKARVPIISYTFVLGFLYLSTFFLSLVFSAYLFFVF